MENRLSIFSQNNRGSCNVYYLLIEDDKFIWSTKSLNICIKYIPSTTINIWLNLHVHGYCNQLHKIYLKKLVIKTLF